MIKPKDVMTYPLILDSMKKERINIAYARISTTVFRNNQKDLVINTQED